MKCGVGRDPEYVYIHDVEAIDKFLAYLLFEKVILIPNQNIFLLFL